MRAKLAAESNSDDKALALVMVSAAILAHRLAFFSLSTRRLAELIGKKVSGQRSLEIRQAIQATLANEVYRSSGRTAAGFRVTYQPYLDFLNLDDAELARQQSELHAFCTAPATNQATQPIAPQPMAPPAVSTRSRAGEAVSAPALELQAVRLKHIDPNSDQSLSVFAANLIAAVSDGNVTSSPDDVDKYSSRLREIIAREGMTTASGHDRPELVAMADHAAIAIREIHAAATRAETASADDDDLDELLGLFLGDEKQQDIEGE